MKYIWTYKTKNGFTDIKMSSDGEFLTGLCFLNSYDSNKKHDGEYIEKKLPIFVGTIKWLDIYFSGKDPGFMPKYKIENST